MKLKLPLLTIFTALSFGAAAQQSEKAALATAAPEVSATHSPDSAASPAVTPVVLPVKTFQKGVSYSLSAGAMGSNLGYATYISPAAYYRISPKFSAFSRFTVVNSQFNRLGSDKAMPMATRNYMVHVGGAYDVNEKLQLSGSIWRDFSGAGSSFPGADNFSQPGRYGADFNAHFKINDNFSIHGGIRTSNGNFHHPAMPYGASFGPSPHFGY